MERKVCVLGSINMDIVVEVDQFPNEGETITGLSLDYIPGGKGANQAVAIANMEVPVDMVGALGDDVFSKTLRGYLNQPNLNIDNVIEVEGSSGVAIVMVNSSGENQIVIIPGSNMAINPGRVTTYLQENGPFLDYIVSQFEVPIESIIVAFEIAKSQGVKTVLNPSPIRPLPTSLIELVDIFVLNKIELSQLLLDVQETHNSFLTIEETVWKLATKKNNQKSVVVTLGGEGVIVIHNNKIVRHEAQQVVEVVDTTGAGDCFCGTLVAFLYKGYSFLDSITVAQKAAAYSVQKKGASVSFPKLKFLG